MEATANARAERYFTVFNSISIHIKSGIMLELNQCLSVDSWLHISPINGLVFVQ